MKYCHNCGAPAADEALFCEKCGAAHGDLGDRGAGRNNYVGLTVLSFIIPLVGLIGYFVWEKTERDKALAAAKGGLMNLSFSSPIVALIVYIIAKENYPDIAKACGICGIISVVISAVAAVIAVIVYVVYIVLVFGSYGYYSGIGLSLMSLLA